MLTLTCSLTLSDNKYPQKNSLKTHSFLLPKAKQFKKPEGFSKCYSNMSSVFQGTVNPNLVVSRGFSGSRIESVGSKTNVRQWSSAAQRKKIFTAHNNKGKSYSTYNQTNSSTSLYFKSRMTTCKLVSSQF